MKTSRIIGRIYINISLFLINRIEYPSMQIIEDKQDILSKLKDIKRIF